MFKCETCSKDIGPGIAEIKVQLVTRPKEYLARSYLFKGETVIDPGGIGWEIEKEIRVCASCARDLEERETTKDWTAVDADGIA